MQNRKIPSIVTELPGPKTQAILEEDQKYISPSYTRAYPLVAHRAKGVTIEDPDGNIFLDMTAGIAVCATGHCHPEIVKAIQDQAEKLIHMSGTDFYYEPQVDLAKKLALLAPGKEPKKVFFSNSGAEAVEGAFKLARYFTGRPRMISFVGAFHGRTMGALSLTNSKIIQKEKFAPFVPQVDHIPYPNPRKCPQGKKQAFCEKECNCVAHIEETLFRSTIPPSDVAAIIVEPIQGEGGYILPPDHYLKDLHQFAKKHGILIIADEVQSGMGRTGKMFASEHFDFEPDIICLAKGIASGMPLGALIASEKIMNWKPGSHASTFGGNPISCAASLKTIELLENGLIENAKEVGSYLLKLLEKSKKKHSIIENVRGLGLMIAVEFNKDVSISSIYEKAFCKGLLLLPCGFHNIRFSPALNVTKKEVEIAVQLLEETLGEL